MQKDRTFMKNVQKPARESGKAQLALLVAVAQPKLGFIPAWVLRATARNGLTAGVGAVLLLCGALTAANAQLVLNGTFAGASGGDGSPIVVPNWTVTPAASGSLIIANNGFDDLGSSTPGGAGAEAIDFSATGNPALPLTDSYDELSQTIPTTVGATYSVSYWLAAAMASSSYFQSYFGDDQNLQTLNTVPTTWTQYTFDVVATSSSTVLAFYGNDAPSYVGIADVEVTDPVPEPTTMIAGALLLLPIGASTLRMLRKRQAA